MSDYVASIEVDATPDRAFAVLTDATRFTQWQGLALRAFDQSGPLAMPGSTVRIDHGPGMKRTLTVLDADPPSYLRYRQQGMGVDETTEVRFATAGSRTKVTMSADIIVAGGPIGRLLARASRGQNQREFQAELERLGVVIDRPGAPAQPPGTLVSADSGAGFRALKILDTDKTTIHVALLPGVAAKRPSDPTLFGEQNTRARDPLGLRPLDVSIRGLASRIVPGQPVLRLDGGIGVPHLALSIDAYTDTLPEPFAQPMDVTAREQAEVTSWRAAGGPVLGGDVNAGVTTLVTIRAEEGYGAAKVLHVDRLGVHVRLYADRWPLPSDHIDPWSLRLGQIGDAAMGVGHMPLTRKAFAGWDPTFARLVMLGPGELDGYRMWLEAAGGYFA